MDWFLRSTMEPPAEGEINWRPYYQQTGVRWEREGPRFADWLWKHTATSLVWYVIHHFARKAILGNVAIDPIVREKEIAGLRKVVQQFFGEQEEKKAQPLYSLDLKIKPQFKSSPIIAGPAWQKQMASAWEKFIKEEEMKKNAQKNSNPPV